MNKWAFYFVLICLAVLGIILLGIMFDACWEWHPS